MGTSMGRGEITQFVERHEAAWEGTTAVLAIAYFVVALQHEHQRRSVPLAVVLAFGVFFILEFSLRFWDAPSRLGYLRTHWIDLVAAIPYVGALSALRLLRMVRLVTALRRLLSIETVSEEGGHHSLWFVWPAVLLLWAGAAYGIWVFERNSNPSLRTYGSAVYWAVITTTTIGYGDVAPKTSEGRVLSGLLALTGIGLVGVLSSQLTTWLVQRKTKVDRTPEDLEAIHRELAELRRLLETRGPAEEAADRTGS